MAIAFVASEEFVNDNNAASYSLAPLPTGTTAGNVCFVVVSCPTDTGGATTFSGWTNVRTLTNGTAHATSVWYRVVQPGDTASTAFTFDNQGTAEGIAYVSAEYSGVDTTTPLIAENGAISVDDADSSLATPSISNTDANAWLVHAIGISDTNMADSSLACTTSPAMTERNDIDGASIAQANVAAWYDSNGTVSVASYSQTGSYDSTDDGTLSVWIGLLKPTATGGSPKHSCGILLG